MPKLEKENSLKVISEREEVIDLGNLFANQILVEIRILHNIVNKIFFPKIGKFDWVTEKDIAMMCLTTQGKPMNMPLK